MFYCYRICSKTMANGQLPLLLPVPNISNISNVSGKSSRNGNNNSNNSNLQRQSAAVSPTNAGDINRIRSVWGLNLAAKSSTKTINDNSNYSNNNDNNKKKNNNNIQQPLSILSFSCQHLLGRHSTNGVAVVVDGGDGGIAVAVVVVVAVVVTVVVVAVVAVVITV